ncbi:MAG: PEGA domain-containing protein [Deltaproteobacteria bacterium]|nr:MAG: PEGA domain-containing protein [Deltaproteobacteria bacterium]
MRRKNPFFILLALGISCLLFATGLQAQLIEPTHSLQGAPEDTGLLNVLSEPPGMEVRLDEKVIGKTPIFAAKFPSGVHALRIKDSETDIHLAAGKTFAVSWFKGSFIEIPEKVKPPAQTAQGLPTPAATPKPEDRPAAWPGTANDPYYWPLNPRGPIY